MFIKCASVLAGWNCKLCNAEIFVEIIVLRPQKSIQTIVNLRYRLHLEYCIQCWLPVQERS